MKRIVIIGIRCKSNSHYFPLLQNSKWFRSHYSLFITLRTTAAWRGLKKLCVAVSFRSIIAEQKKEPEMTVRYYISSADLTAEKFATAIRNHWHVENKLHWRLDVVMNEDDCKIRRGNAAELFSGIRHIAINILTNDKVFKAGLRRKMRKAAMDRNYLASVLAGSGLS
ncbi:ISAs1 family transposase [Escherichia coli]|uniref:ISAs1 family transposase n=1 Tax=Escherichia coli TaxID=562 RepID=UPI003EBE9240